MDFEEITESSKVFPGEYLLYVPRNTIVLCGAYTGDIIRALDNGALIEDKPANFKKINLNREERSGRRNYISRCKGCGS
jgi:hypothetical protein